MSVQNKTSAGPEAALQSLPRLIGLRHEAILQIHPGTRTQVSSGFWLTVIPENNSALAEVGPERIGESEMVRIGGVQVYDVAHVESGSVITDGALSWIFQMPLQVFIKTEGRTPYRQIMQESTSVGLPTAPRVRLALSASIAIAVLVLTFAFITRPTAVTAPTAVVPKITQTQEVHSGSEQSAIKAGEVSKIEAQPVNAVLASSTSTELLPAVSSSTELVPAVAPAPEPEAKTVKTASMQVPRAPIKPKIQSPNVKGLDSLRERLESYRLESRFDPEGARAKISDLIKPLTRNHPVAQEASVILKGIGR